MQRPWGAGEMAARSVGCGVRRLRSVLQGPRGWPPRGGSGPRRAASGPRGSAPCAGAALPSSYPALRALAEQQPDAFWGPLARDMLVWDTPFHTVWDCDFSRGKIGWFLGGRLNVSGEWAAGTRAPPAQTSRGDSERGRQGRLPSLPLRCHSAAPHFPGFSPRPGVSSGRPAAGPACPAASSNGGLSSVTAGAAGDTRAGWGGGCRVHRSRDFPVLGVTTSCPPGDWPGEICCPSKQTERRHVAWEEETQGPAAGITYLLAPWRCLWEGRQTGGGASQLSVSDDRAPPKSPLPPPKKKTHGLL